MRETRSPPEPDEVPRAPADLTLSTVDLQISISNPVARAFLRDNETCRLGLSVCLNRMLRHILDHSTAGSATGNSRSHIVSGVEK